MNEDEFEEWLGRELGEPEVPRGFADGVMERVNRRQALRAAGLHGVKGHGVKKASEPVRVPRWRFAVAAGLVAAVGLATAGYQVEGRREAREARAQFGLAMRVTHHSLASIDRGLDRIDKSDGNPEGGTR